MSVFDKSQTVGNVTIVTMARKVIQKKYVTLITEFNHRVNYINIKRSLIIMILQADVDENENNTMCIKLL